MVNFWIRDEVWKRGTGRKPVMKKKGEKKRNAERKRNKVRQIEGEMEKTNRLGGRWLFGTRREGRKEMQRLPYNGGPRAHKLRHDVIPSSLFNERWQPLHVYTRTLYKRIVPSSSLELDPSPRFPYPPVVPRRTCCEPRCQVSQT